MIPIGDDNSGQRGKPVVTWILIGLNVLVFVFLQKFALDDYATVALAAIPEEILSGHRLFTLITSQFTHAGFMHIIGNMLFLGVFGDNVECRIGKLRYSLLYIISGTIGILLQIFAAALTGGAALQMPLVGASAAISGVLAAYLALFPGNKVVVLLFYFIPTALSAWLVIGFWFILQVLGGLSGLMSVQNGGTAYLAHIGGFLSAYIWAKTYKRKELEHLRHSRRRAGASGDADGFRWWIVDDN
jgi:membrane associated rhomboid family serine protease